MCKVTSYYSFERYADKLKTSTTALSDHIMKYHHLTKHHNVNEVLAGKPINTKDIRNYITKEVENPTLEDALLDWITYSNKAFTVTENPWFTRMLRAAGYAGRIPKAEAIKRKLVARIDGVQAQIINDIQNTSSTIYLTLDAWTSKSKKAIIAINLRWLDQDFHRHQHCISSKSKATILERTSRYLSIKL